MLTLMMLAFGGIVVRLAFLQVRDNPELEALGLQQRVRTFTCPRAAGRSSIARVRRSPITRSRPATCTWTLATSSMPAPKPSRSRHVLDLRRT